jgi:IclR family pca regulon transcriptional regulator
MAGVAKGLAILECFGKERPRMTCADAARLTGLTRPTARRCLLTLRELEYVSFDGKYYRPEPRLLRLTSAYLSSVELTQIAQSVMDKIRDETGETVSLTIMEGTEMVYIARASVTRVLLTGAAIGVRVPAYCSAGGRAWLATMPDKKVQAYLRTVKLVRRTPHTVIDPDKLLAIVQQARKQGYATQEEELELGTRSIGVSVVASGDRVIGALTLGCPAARMTMDEMVAKLLPKLREGSSLLSNAY